MSLLELYIQESRLETNFIAPVNFFSFFFTEGVLNP